MLPSLPEGERRAGAALIVTLLLAPALAGCLAQEDDPSRRFFIGKPPEGDFAAPPPPKPPEENVTGPAGGIPDDPSPDPRLNLSAPWKRGDKWYYESNQSRFMRQTVLGVRVIGGTPYYLLRTETGLIGYAPTTTTVSRVTLDFRTVNSTLNDGFTEFDPPHPGIRFLPRWGTFEYNDSGYQRLAGRDVVWDRHVRVLVTESWPLYPVKIPAGKYLASHFTVYTSILAKGKEKPDLVQSERWYSPDVRNDVMIKTAVNSEKSEWFQLVYFVQNGTRHGLSIEYER